MGWSLILEFRVNTKVSNRSPIELTNKFLSLKSAFCFSLVKPSTYSHNTFSLKVSIPGARFRESWGLLVEQQKFHMLGPKFPPHSVVNEDRSQPSPVSSNLDAHFGGWIIQIMRIIYLRKIWISNDIDVSKIFWIDFNCKWIFSKNLHCSLKHTCLVLGFAFPRLNSFHQHTLKTCTR